MGFFLCCIVQKQQNRRAIFEAHFIEMSNRFKAVGLFCRALWGESSLPCRPILQFFSENFNFFLLFSECFQFPRSQFPVGCGDFLFFPAVFILFSSFPFYTYYKEDFHYEHHYRHRPRLLCYQNSPLFIPGWVDKLWITRTLHPPRTLRVWRVLFCLWLRAAAYPAGQDRKRQLLPADTGSYRKGDSSTRFASRMLGANCGGSAADVFRTR